MPCSFEQILCTNFASFHRPHLKQVFNGFFLFPPRSSSAKEQRNLSAYAHTGQARTQTKTVPDGQLDTCI